MDLAERIALVRTNLRHCTLCPRECGVDRLRGELGTCGLTAEGRVFHHYLSHAEELAISPTYEILFTGCSQRCRFCAVHEHVVRPASGRAASADEIRRGLEAAATEGLRSVSIVGGEPIVNLLAALELLQALPFRHPLAWNSNMYASPFVHEVLDGLVDVFVGDLHFGNDDCAREVGGVAPYWDLLQDSLVRAHRSARLIVRHLLLPGHHECCFVPAARWLRQALPDVEVHVMGGFLPRPRTTGPLARELPASQARKAVDFARELELRLVEA